MKRTFILVALVSLALSGCAGTPVHESAQRPRVRPNVLFIFTDDHAAHAVGAYGSRFPADVTPNLDRIAADGMLFRNCFVSNSICAPSRAVILTGKHSHLNGVRTNWDRFDGEQMTFPKMLGEAGYQAALIGKWHLKSEPTGFDYYERLLGQGPYYNPKMRRDGVDRQHTGYTTDIITDLAIEWLEEGRDSDKPFVMMVQHKAPHRHWQPAPRHLDYLDDVTIAEPENLFDDYSGRGSAAAIQDMEIASTLTPHDLKLALQRGFTAEQRSAWDAAYEPKNAAFKEANLKGDDLVRWKYQRYLKDYLRCIKAVDENIGRLLATLEENGLDENTVVIYSSDQGFFLGEHGWFDKRFMYEECYRMPFLVRWPGVVPAGVENNDLISNIDFAETFLDLAGVDETAMREVGMQGESLVPLMLGNTPSDWRESLYYQYFEYFGDAKTSHMVRRHRGVRTARYKLIDFYNLGEWELYDLEKDPFEMKSVAEDRAYGTVRARLSAELDRLATLYQVPDDRGSVPYDPHRLIEKKLGRKGPPTPGS